ncbi:uncharacterized protein LOC124681180 isoform X2 [Lolium rigidum]|uniref:uncharacterized protein LOC124681180 isoform X2 n=1 Tax=Lolium rigidum TaxID=89674 RepID=UPI001F5D8A74|nr:uncharacterized protein LOC124681180 isoform X2 [Lolium rigidum]XP_047072096.1 uncharacterized protein LOC124681180 isoform X2 [Lolium rigidum]
MLYKPKWPHGHYLSCNMAIDMDLIMRRVSRQRHDGENADWSSMRMTEFFLEEMRKISSMKVHLHNCSVKPQNNVDMHEKGLSAQLLEWRRGGKGGVAVMMSLS